MTDDEEAETMIKRLRKIAIEREKLDDERDELIRHLMGTKTPRDKVAEAAGLKVARLYQIRDGSR